MSQSVGLTVGREVGKDKGAMMIELCHFTTCLVDDYLAKDHQRSQTGRVECEAKEIKRQQVG